MAKVDPTEFVRLWMSNTRTAEMAKQLGCSQAYIYQFAERLRERGVKLPERASHKDFAVNVNELNKLITSGGDK